MPEYNLLETTPVWLQMNLKAVKIPIQLLLTTVVLRGLIRRHLPNAVNHSGGTSTTLVARQKTVLPLELKEKFSPGYMFTRSLGDTLSGAELARPFPFLTPWDAEWTGSPGARRLFTTVWTLLTSASVSVSPLHDASDDISNSPAVRLLCF